jgi:hypothetical protein
MVSEFFYSGVRKKVIYISHITVYITPYQYTWTVERKNYSYILHILLTIYTRLCMYL